MGRDELCRVIEEGEVKALSEKILGVTLVVYIALDILLTPVAGFETRPVSRVTAVGFVVLGLLFMGLVLGIISLVMLVRRSPRVGTTAIVAAVLYFPAVIAEQTGHFSALRPPAAIELIELLQAAVALVLVGVGFSNRRQRP
jgi:CHASE2 domain-containing sensor protein